MLAAAIALTNIFNSKQQNKLPLLAHEILNSPAHELSKQIKDGSLTASKLCVLYVVRMKQVQPFINAMAQDRFKEAIDEANRIDQLLASFRSGSKSESELSEEEQEMLRSPLLGIPISVKESIQVKGMRNSCGLWSRRDHTASEDAVLVMNARRLGMIPICTTNIPECTFYWADCQNKVYGRTKNPYDLSRISGASSGGEAALLGAGASLLGIGSDIGGSLRIPAHYCGVFSHKASPFLLSPEGNFPEVNECRMRMFTLGPMARYASDLRYLLKCLLSDKGNLKQDMYFKFQPKDIAQKRQNLIQRLDDPVDLSGIKIFYFDFNESSRLTGRQSLKCQQELMDAQKELIDHFSSKFGAKCEHINLDDYMKKMLITWQCLLRGGGCDEPELYFKENELKHVLEIDSLVCEFIKMPIGLSKHTKESLLSILVGQAIPEDPKQAYPLCEKFEKIAQDHKNDIELRLGDHGVLIMPTLPTIAYKHNEAMLKTHDLRFPCTFNVLQLPTTHATMRLDKRNKMPFGFSIAAKQYQDHLTLAVAEEIEKTFGGWTEPTSRKDETSDAASKATKATKASKN